MAPDELLVLFGEVTNEIRGRLDSLADWGLRPGSDAQHHSDLAADAVAVRALRGAGLGVLSEESGAVDLDASIVVVVDPLDGSTNAAQGIPWYATSLCAVDSAGPLAALVTNLASGEQFAAVRGGGAIRDGRPIRPSAVVRLDKDRKSVV